MASMLVKDRLSVVVITKNEEDAIRACLESVKWASEIIIVDDESSDATVTICAEYTDKIFRRKMDGFGAQKQFGVDQATGDWILVLDADERVSPALAEEIDRILESGSDCDGFNIWRQTFYAGRWIRHCGWYNPVLRLFKKGRGRLDMRYVHESIVVPGPVGEIRSHITHHSYKNIGHHIRKIALYTDYDARSLYEAGVRVQWRNAAFYYGVKPLLSFLRKYILMAGFLDGSQGVCISVFTAVAVFLNYMKLGNLQRTKKTGAMVSAPAAARSNIPSPPRIGVVVVTFNNAAQMGELLRDLSVQTRKPDEIIVIDNASIDDTRTVVQRSPVPVRYIRFDVNKGSAGGFREGLRLACESNDLVWLLDDDVFVEREALRRIAEGMERLAGSENVGAVRSWGQPVAPFALPKRAQNFAWRGTMIRRDVVESIGLPRTEYFLYGEDTEYAKRMLKKGYAAYLIPDSHVVERSTGGRTTLRFMGVPTTVYKDTFRLYYATRNQFSVFLEYRDVAGLVRSVLYVCRVVLLLGVASGGQLFERVAAVCRGVWDGLGGHLGANRAYMPSVSKSGPINGAASTSGKE